MSDWISCKHSLPQDGVVVQTKIDDSHGVRNVQKLKLSGRVWFTPDGGTYVYYCPTHWREAEADL